MRFFVFLCVLFFAVSANVYARPVSSSLRQVSIQPPSQISPPQAALVIDAQSGAVLFSENSDIIIHPASLTKLMTLDVLFNLLDKGVITEDTLIPVSQNAAGQPNTRLGLIAGQTIRVGDAIRALLVHSCNDVATAVAEFISGSEEKFAQNMTLRAHALGMINTNFTSASGLPNPANVSTARDLTTLTLSLLKRHPQDLGYFSVKYWIYNGRHFENSNKLLGVYPGLDAGKTGYVRASGFNLFASAVRGGRRLISVVIGGASAAKTANRTSFLLNQSFAQPPPVIQVSARGY